MAQAEDPSRRVPRPAGAAAGWLGPSGRVHPDAHDDPVAAVLRARAEGGDLGLLTSGTSDRPRRVLRSTDSWWDSFDAYSELSGVTARARLWVPGPLTSTMCLFAATHATWARASLVDVPATATHACLTPSQLERRSAELRPGTRVTVAGAALGEREARAARDRGLVLAHYYGAAELSFVAAGTSDADLAPFVGVEVDLREASGGQEVWVRSPYLAHGYDGAPGSLRRDPDGWASVGDLGRLEGRHLVVLGRPDAVITAGATVLLADVEAALAPAAGHPFAVHPVPHPVHGEVVAVTVTDELDLAPLRARARRELSASHRPRVWRTRPELPLTPAGKVDRARLSEEAS